MAQDSRYGTGLAQPLQLTEQGDWRVLNRRELIAQSILDILGTPQGSRLDLPGYGSQLHRLIFEPNAEILESLMETFIEEAIREFEPRVTYDSTEFIRDPGQVDRINCQIHVRDKVSQKELVLVYPFYQELDA